MRSRIALASILTALGFAAACGAVHVPGSASPSPGGGHIYVATDADNGKTLSVHVGDQLKVQLASTYWRVAGSSNPDVLRPIAPAVVSPQPNGCVAGGGCGTVTMVFDVVGAGAAEVTASRNSCGEAMGCTASEASFRIAVDAAA
jgi:hypothetical protein